MIKVSLKRDYPELGDEDLIVESLEVLTEDQLSRLKFSREAGLSDCIYFNDTVTNHGLIDSSEWDGRYYIILFGDWLWYYQEVSRELYDSINMDGSFGEVCGGKEVLG